MTIRNETISTAQKSDFNTKVLNECSTIMSFLGNKIPFKIVGINGVVDRLVLNVSYLTLREMRHLRYRLDDYFDAVDKKTFSGFSFIGNSLFLKAENIEMYFQF